MTGKRASSGAYIIDGRGGSGGGRRHDGVVIIMVKDRSRATSEGRGKSGLAGAGEIHQNGALGCGPERVSLKISLKFSDLDKPTVHSTSDHRIPPRDNIPHNH